MKTSGKETKRKTLKQKLEENERLFRETRHLFGLKELRLKEKDPLSYNILWNIGAKVAHHLVPSPLLPLLGILMAIFDYIMESLNHSHTHNSFFSSIQAV